MNKMIVGDDDCPVLSVCNTLRNTSAFEISSREIFKLAKEIIGNDVDAEHISDCIVYKGCSIYQAYSILLQKWRDKDGKEATLDRFLETLNAHKLFDSIVKIRKRFESPPRPIKEPELSTNKLDVKNEKKDNFVRSLSELPDEISEDLLKFGIVSKFTKKVSKKKCQTEKKGKMDAMANAKKKIMDAMAKEKKTKMDLIRNFSNDGGKTNVTKVVLQKKLYKSGKTNMVSRRFRNWKVVGKERKLKQWEKEPKGKGEEKTRKGIKWE